MARNKKPTPPGSNRLNALRDAALQEHASAEFLSGMLESARHAELAGILKASPRGLHEFQKFLAEFAAIIRDTEHQMVAHEFATFIGMRLSQSKAVRGIISPELEALPKAELVQRLAKDFMSVVSASRSMFLECELAEIMLAEMVYEKPGMTLKERKKHQADLEAYALDNIMPVLKQVVAEQRAWVKHMDEAAKPKPVQELLNPLEALTFGRFVAKA